MYIVIRDFCDLQDGKYLYREGDEFPRDGLKVSEKRLHELSTAANKVRSVLIKKVPDPVQVDRAPEPEPDSKAEKKGRRNARRITEGSEELLHS